MTKKIFLTSVIAMCIVCPSFAEEFPADGYMQENKTYDNAATEGNMDGVYEGTVNANAEYDDILYTISAGKYLPAGGESVVDCNVSGSFCPGLQSQVTYDANNAQGLTSCSDATSGAYTLSDGTGSTADSCYRTCSGNVTIEHATAVSGNDYYGAGTDTCEPTECVNGWHIKPGLNLATAVGTGRGANYAYVSGSGSFSQSSDSSVVGSVNHDQAFYGITANNTWAVYYGDNGMVTGQARCSSASGTGAFNGASSASDITTHTTAELGAEGGEYCYCNVTGYTPAGGTLQSLSSPWVVSNVISPAANCASVCASSCANSMRYDASNHLLFRAALLGSVGASPAMCEANTITINWSDADDENIESKRSVTYGGDVVTPVKAVTKPGKTFKGWKFSK